MFHQRVFTFNVLFVNIDCYMGVVNGRTVSSIHKYRPMYCVTNLLCFVSTTLWTTLDTNTQRAQRTTMHSVTSDEVVKLSNRGASRTLYEVLGLGLGLGPQVLDNWPPHNNFTFYNYSMK